MATLNCVRSLNEGNRRIVISSRFREITGLCLISCQATEKDVQQLEREFVTRNALLWRRRSGS